MEQKCSRCGVERDISLFRVDPKTGKHRSICKKCIAEYKKKYDAEHPSANVNIDREKLAHNKRMKNFGVSKEMYERMLQDQNGVCAVCGRDNRGKSLCVDHDHKTGAVRGLLCHKCNLALGMAEDNLDTLKNLVSYLLRK